MLIDATLDNVFWGNAVLRATYLINITLTKTVANILRNIIQKAASETFERVSSYRICSY